MLLAEFDEVLILSGTSLNNLLYDSFGIDHSLSNYGRALYNMNRSLGDYAETINSVVAKNRRLRKLLMLSWDGVDVWTWIEPSVPRIAIPENLARALVAVNLCNGRPFSAWFAWLSFAFLLRPSETLLLQKKEPASSLTFSRAPRRDVRAPLFHKDIPARYR